MSTEQLLRAVVTASVLIPGLALADDAPAASASPASATAPAPGAESGVSAAVPPADAPVNKNPNGRVDEPAYPLSGSVGLAYRFNHSNFVPTESGHANYGTGQGSIDIGASYTFLEKYSLDVGVSASKELKSSYFGSGSAETTKGATDFSDSSIGLSANDLYKIPVLGIGISAGISASIPTSKASQAQDIYTSVSPGISLGWSWERLSLGANFGANYTFSKYRTVHIQQDSARNNEIISGADTGDPLVLWSLSEGGNLGVKIVDGLKFSFGYSVSHNMLSTTGRDDEYTAGPAQTGTQWGVPSHGTSFGLSYAFLEKSSVAVRMGTRVPMNIRGETTNPFFDTRTNTYQRTNYSVSVSQSF